MTGVDPNLVFYTRVYQASSQLFWKSRRPWEQQTGWPRERREAWSRLQRVLTEDVAFTAGPDTPPDPTRFLASRRAEDGRPIPLADAVRDWLTRVEEQTSPPYFRQMVAESPEMRGQKTLTTDFVLVTRDWCAEAMTAVGELRQRIAPGRPACVINGAQGLPEALHDYADELRAALAGHGEPLARPAVPPPGADVPTPFVRGVDAAGLDRLCRAARAVTEQTPGLSPAPTTPTAGVDVEVRKAVDVLRHTLAGEEAHPWRDFNPDVDPADHLVSSGESLAFGAYLERLRTSRPAPRVPDAPVAVDTGEDGVAYSGIPFPTARVLVEVFDELAARLTPGRRTETVAFDTYPAYHALAAIGRLLYDF